MLSTDSSTVMLPAERRAVLFLTLIYAVRMIGLFIMLPVLVLYGATLEQSSPALLGFAMGVYGLTQALLQIPYGIWSDRYGRHRMIAAGLLVFAGGSLLAAWANTIYELILGRALQGAGAVAGVVMALAADLTRPNQRNKAMAVIGISIGASFLLSIVLGPLLYSRIGGDGIFYLVAVLALLAIGLLYAGVPEVSSITRTEPPRIFPSAILTPGLIGIYSGIFILHAVLTANFSVLPLILQDILGLPAERHWPIYLLAMLGGVLVMVPGLLYAEKLGRIKTFVTSAAIVLAFSQVGIIVLYGYTLTPYGLVGLLLIFFAAFNSLEAVLPSLVSKTVPAGHKGAALGAYSTCQFLGSFAGGLAAGLAMKAWGHQGVFVIALLLSLLWLPAAFRVRTADKYECYAIKLDAGSGNMLERLRDVAGVREVSVLEKEGMVYVHVDKNTFDLAAFNRIVQQS
jgi:MFS family permease